MVYQNHEFWYTFLILCCLMFCGFHLRFCVLQTFHSIFIFLNGILKLSNPHKSKQGKNMNYFFQYYKTLKKIIFYNQFMNFLKMNILTFPALPEYGCSRNDKLKNLLPLRTVCGCVNSRKPQIP